MRPYLARDQRQQGTRENVVDVAGAAFNLGAALEDALRHSVGDLQRNAVPPLAQPHR